MSALDEHINRVQVKLQQLVKQHASLRKENRKLGDELSQARSVIKDKDSQIELLTLRLEVLKASKGEMTDPEKNPLKKKSISTSKKSINVLPF